MIDGYTFTFIISLAAVINGLGIVRWLGAAAELLRRGSEVQFQMTWTYCFFASLQFLLHILLWWSLWGVREVIHFNFATYLYLLCGPILLFLGSSLLAPHIEVKNFDLRTHYDSVRKSYWTIFALVSLWAIFLWPIMIGSFAPTVPILSAYFLMALVLRLTDNPRVHFVCSVVALGLIILFVGLYQLQLGAVTRSIVNQ